MKKGVGFGRAIRNGIIVILVFFIALGTIAFVYDFVPQSSNKTQLESIETTAPEESSTTLIPDLSEQISEEFFEDDFKESENNLPSEKSDVSEEVATQEESETQEETFEQPEEITEVVSDENAVMLPSLEESQDYVGTICLTFDDGPSTEITNQILDILQEKNVKATFFILNYDEETLSIINREIEGGHTVALHGYSHDYATVYSSLEAIQNNFLALQEKLYADTGYYSNFIRFPGGSSNTVSKKYCEGIMTEATQSLTKMGFSYFDWNVDSQDAGGAKSAEEIYNNVTSTLVEGRTNVVLMHDASNKIFTVEALSSIIDYGIEHGFEFKPITQETKVVQHNVNN